MAQTNESQEQVTINVETLQPVTRTLMTTGALPTSYLISMTYEEQLLWLQNYLIKTVIPAINNNAEATQEVQDIVMALQDYINTQFSELNLQEYVDNKLDEMLESGVFENILMDYVQLTKVYDTYNEMIFEASTFTNGMKLKTMGYHFINDGGGADYIVTNVQSDTKYQVSIGTNLWIEMIIKDSVNVKQFGVYGDGEIDDTVAFQNALNYANGKKINIDNLIILLTNTITCDNLNLEGFNTTIKLNGEIDYLININQNGNCEINNLNFIKVDNSFNNLNRFIYGYQANEIIIKNCSFNNYGTAIHAHYCNKLIAENIKFINTLFESPQYGYGIDTSSKINYIKNIMGENSSSDYGRHAIYLNGTIMEETNIDTVSIKNWCHNPIQINITTQNQPQINIRNIVFDNVNVSPLATDSLGGCINVAQDSMGLINIDNIKCDNLISVLIASMSVNAILNINNIYVSCKDTTFNNMRCIYIRYSSNHTVNNFVNLQTGANFLVDVYIRNATNVILNNIVNNDSNNTNALIFANNSTLSIGTYKNSGPVVTNTNSTVSALSFYSV